MGIWLLVYDADCGPCTRFKRVIDFLDSYNRLDFIPLVEAGGRGLLNSVPKFRRYRSFHLISPDLEKALSGSNALPQLTSLLPLGMLLSGIITWVPAARKLVNFLYSTFARLHDSGYCEYETLSPGNDGLRTTKNHKRKLFFKAGVLKRVFSLRMDE